MNTYDVVVVGAGPVGLISALVLAEAEYKILLIEKRGQLNQVSKASTFHAPTLDILNRLGVYEEFSKKALHIDRLQYRTPDHGILGELSYDLLKGLTDYPFRKHLEQSLLTPILLKTLRTFANVDVIFNAEYQNCIDHGDGVEITYTTEKEENIVKARFLLGADGAHSVVRESVGITFTGNPYPGFQLRIRTDDGIMDEVKGIGPVTYLVGKTHSVSFLHMPDNWRVILRVPEGISEETALTDDWAIERLNMLISGFKLPKVVDKDCYAARKCIASSAHKGNVFIAGDAIHLTNTRGGMNMNCGIHDGFVIASAMVQSLKNKDMNVLVAAANERHRVGAEMLLPRTDAMISKEKEWIERVSGYLEDPKKGQNYLSQTAMLDMVQLP